MNRHKKYNYSGETSRHPSHVELCYEDYTVDLMRVINFDEVQSSSENSHEDKRKL